MEKERPDIRDIHMPRIQEIKILKKETPPPVTQGDVDDIYDEQWEWRLIEEIVEDPLQGGDPDDQSTWN